MRKQSLGAVAVTVAAAVAIAGCGRDAADPPVGTVANTVTSTASPSAVHPTSSSAAISTTARSEAASDGRHGVSVHVTGTRGSTTIDVDLPQVEGGAQAVTQRFNSGMRATLDDLAGRGGDVTVGNGELLNGERSRVTSTGPRTVSGVAIYSSYVRGAAHPDNSVATIVINAETAHPIVLSSAFADPSAAAARLSQEVARADSRAARQPADLAGFANWVPLPEGFHVYLSVSHALGDFLPVTVPWSAITDLLEPSMKPVLIGA